MEGNTEPAYRDEEFVAREIMGRFDAPAFIRRARRVEDGYQFLLAQLRRERGEKITIVRLRLGQLRAQVTAWEVLAPLLHDPEVLHELSSLHDELQPELRLPLPRTDSARVHRAALGELAEAIAIFNVRWQAHLGHIDLGPLNAERDGYNRYYLLERECAVGASRSTRQAFRPLPMLTAAHLLELFPPLPVIRVTGL